MLFVANKGHHSETSSVGKKKLLYNKSLSTNRMHCLLCAPLKGPPVKITAIENEYGVHIYHNLAEALHKQRLSKINYATSLVPSNSAVTIVVQKSQP